MVRPARMALDDKLYQRDLEVALALSVKELPTGTTDVEESRDKSTDRRGNDEAETVNKSPHLSNCSVASDYLDLDKITEEEDARGVRGRRRAASRAVVQQRSVLSEGSDGGGADDSEPDFATGEESEDDSDFSESGDDEAFTMRKSKGKRMKRKEAKVKSPVEKKEKKPKSARDATDQGLITSPLNCRGAIQAVCFSSAASRLLLDAQTCAGGTLPAPCTPLQTVPSSHNALYAALLGPLC
ncbi:hypothetical protein CB1_000216046 [Camelus ferus]|nr:hypothetical protein CB1_000216046 [Camelus ferus]